ncbi:MAG: hypothetical protein O2887_06885, partial [Bacteroidetes bacterium]|nr:hypothetical protein [Bacteroidota bacterium]
ILLMSFGISVHSPIQKNQLRSYKLAPQSEVKIYKSSSRLYKDYKPTSINFGGGGGWEGGGG